MSESDNPEEEFQIDNRLEDLYDKVKDYESISGEELNPSWYGLTKIKKRYQSYEFIGQGGMKDVYKVLDAPAKRYVAYASLREDAPEELVDSFIHEAWLSAHLDHPNIIKIHDVGLNEESRPFFTMDLKQGNSLEDVLFSEPEKEESLIELLHVFKKICDTIAFSHSKNVLHLDLKPANVQIGAYGEVVVCDWGLGRMLPSDENPEDVLLHPDIMDSVHLFGNAKGTPGFMAPEQFNQGELDPRTDIYGLGCILYSILTRELTVSGSLNEIQKFVSLGKIESPRQRKPESDIPKALDAVVMKAISASPGDRYHSASELGEEVQRYLEGFATAAEDASTATQLKLFYQRNQFFCRTVFLLLSLLSFVVCSSFYSLQSKEKATRLAHEETKRALALYEEGKVALLDQSKKTVQSIVKHSLEFQFAGSYERSEELLVEALSKKPMDYVLTRSLAEFHLVQQHFAKAKSYFGNLKSPSSVDTYLMELCQRYGAKKSVSEKILSVSDFCHLITDLEFRDSLQVRMILHDQRWRFDLKQRAQIIETYLKQLNPDWKEGWFEFNETKKHLRVGGLGLRELSINSSVISGLQLKSLDISSSEIDSLWKETESPLESINIKDTHISKLWVFQRFINLKTLILNPEKFDDHQLKWIPKDVEIKF